MVAQRRVKFQKTLDNMETLSKLLGVITNHGITLAGEGFHLRAVDNFHRTATVCDEAGFLQQAGGERDTGAISAKHGRKEIVSDVQRGS